MLSLSLWLEGLLDLDANTQISIYRHATHHKNVELPRGKIDLERERERGKQHNII